MVHQFSRRQFIENSILATAAAAAASYAMEQVPFANTAYAQDVSKNEQLGYALIGSGGRGGEHLNYFTTDKRVKILYIVDADLQRAEQKAASVEKKCGYKPKAVADIRKILDDKAIDIVSIATCNHWHALATVWALQAGKHCYTEKPLTHNIHEGKAIVAAAEKYKRLVQTGTQCRSNPSNIEATKYVHEGNIGEAKFARGICYRRRPAIGALGEYEKPDYYDLWSGPAQIKPVTRPKFHYDWHWQRYYGNGDLGNQGPHQTDIARWFLQLDRFPQSVITYGGRLGYQTEKKDPNYIDAGDTANEEVCIYDYGDKCIVFETRGLPTPFRFIPPRDKTAVKEDIVSSSDTIEKHIPAKKEDNTGGTGVGVLVYGSKGYAVQASYSYSAAFDLEGNLVKEFKGGSDKLHYENFVDAVLANDPKKLNADGRTGALSAAVSHLGNISYYLGEQNKVSVDELAAALKSVKSLDDNGAALAAAVEHLEKNGVDLKKTPLALGPQLKIDVEKEIFIGNDKANEYLTRDYRKEFEVPVPEKV